ncbi:unnamed protein product [Closterium sp. NIES-65]|nr:unnamed protein product [Closterium sp. NIES-65]
MAAGGDRGEGWLVGAIDQGTTSTRFFLYDDHLRVVASHQMEFEQIQPQAGWVEHDPIGHSLHGPPVHGGSDSSSEENATGGLIFSLPHLPTPLLCPAGWSTTPCWVEHDPMVILSTVHQCMEGAMAAARSKGVDVGPDTVRAVGLTNQRETTVVWRRSTGEPLYNAIVWMDVRTSAVCQRLEQQLSGGRDEWRGVTGLPLSTYFSALKLAWLLEEVPAVRQAVEEGDALFGTIDTWLIWNLTGGACHVTDSSNASRTLLMDLWALQWSQPIQPPFPFHTPTPPLAPTSTGGACHVTDSSNASRTLLMDLRALEWSQPILDALNIPRSILPSIISSAAHRTYCLSWPLAGVPLSGCLGDQHTATQQYSQGHAHRPTLSLCYPSSPPCHPTTSEPIAPISSSWPLVGVPLSGCLGDQHTAVLGQRCTHPFLSFPLCPPFPLSVPSEHHRPHLLHLAPSRGAAVGLSRRPARGHAGAAVLTIEPIAPGPASPSPPSPPCGHWQGCRYRAALVTSTLLCWGSEHIAPIASSWPLAGVPLSGCLGDQHAAMLGQRCSQGQAKATFGTGCFMLLNTGPQGQAKATFGTGCFMLLNTGPQVCTSQHGLLSTVAFQLGRKEEERGKEVRGEAGGVGSRSGADAAECTEEAGTRMGRSASAGSGGSSSGGSGTCYYALEGSIAIAGAAVQWLRDNLGIISSTKDVEALAASVPHTGGVYFVQWPVQCLRDNLGIISNAWDVKPLAASVPDTGGCTSCPHSGECYGTHDHVTSLQAKWPVQCLRDNLGIISNAREVECLAASVPHTGGVYCVPAFSGLFAPRWREDARGVIVGLSRFTTRAHIARAVLEAIAWQVGGEGRWVVKAGGL